MYSRLASLRYFCQVAAVAIVLAAGSAQADAAAWSNASGANAAFGWSGGGNDSTRFGDPVVTELGFQFSNMNNFRAEVGGEVSVADLASVTINVEDSVPAGAPAIHSITIEEWGTWSVVGTESAEQVFDTSLADFSVGRRNPTPMGNTYDIRLPNFNFHQDGTWSVSKTLTAGELNNPLFADLDWIRFTLTVTNTIQVQPFASPGTFIEKTGMRIILPEPTSIFLVLAGLVPLVFRRSRN